jgi:acetyl-CoA carboxylase carboxyltransferase component
MEKQIVEIKAEDIIKDVQKIYDLIDRCNISKEYIKVINFGKFFEDNNKYYEMILTAIERCDELEVGIIADEDYKVPPPQIVMDKMPNLIFDRTKIAVDRGKN